MQAIEMTSLIAGGGGGGLIIDLISDEKGRDLLTSGGNQDSLKRHFNYLFAYLNKHKILNKSDRISAFYTIFAQGRLLTTCLLPPGPLNACV